MRTIKIEIKEVLSRVIEIKANSKIDALEQVKSLYKSETIVLDADDFIQVDFCFVAENPEKEEEKLQMS